MNGALLARFEQRGGRTELVRLRCQPPLQALRALRAGSAAELVVATLGPGLMGGDLTRLEVEAGADTEVRVGSTGATRVLTARGWRGATAEVSLVAGDGARLTYRPRPTILQAGACYRQRIEIRPPAAGPTFMMEVIVAGAFGAQACQAEKIRAAWDCDSFQDTPNTRAV